MGGRGSSCRRWPVADFAIGVAHEERIVRLGDHEAELLESVLIGCGCRVGVAKECYCFLGLPADTRGGDYAQRTWVVCRHVVHACCIGSVVREVESLLRWVVEEEVFEHGAPPAVRIQRDGQKDGIADNELYDERIT